MKNAKTKRPGENCTGRTLVVSTRLPYQMAVRLDSIAAARSEPGLLVTRADALRIVLLAGLEVVEGQRAPALAVHLEQVERGPAPRPAKAPRRAAKL
jgi:hypothetical protein